jgi:hypothetical protein
MSVVISRFAGYCTRPLCGGGRKASVPADRFPQTLTQTFRLKCDPGTVIRTSTSMVRRAGSHVIMKIDGGQGTYTFFPAIELFCECGGVKAGG